MTNEQLSGLPWQYEDIRLEWDMTLLRLSDRGTHETVLLTVDEARALRDWLNKHLPRESEPQTAKAMEDAVASIRGIGFMKVTPEGIQHIPQAEVYRPVDEPQTTKARKCHANMYSDPPQDCDAPFCGCDPAWSTAIEMLQECGWESPESLRAMGLERTKDGWKSAQASPKPQIRKACLPCIDQVPVVKFHIDSHGARRCLDDEPWRDLTPEEEIALAPMLTPSRDSARGGNEE